MNSIFPLLHESDSPRVMLTCYGQMRAPAQAKLLSDNVQSAEVLSLS